MRGVGSGEKFGVGGEIPPRVREDGSDKREENENSWRLPAYGLPWGLRAAEKPTGGVKYTQAESRESRKEMMHAELTWLLDEKWEEAGLNDLRPAVEAVGDRHLTLSRTEALVFRRLNADA